LFVTNPSSLSNTYKTKSIKVKDYLIKNDIPLLSQDESGFYYFSDTNKLKQALDEYPY
jgi:hypothetical protein